MNLLTREAFIGPEAADGRNHLILEALAALKVALPSGKIDEEIAHESAHGHIALGSLDARPAIDIIRQ